MKKEDLQPTTNSKKNTFNKWFVLISFCMNSQYLPFIQNDQLISFYSIHSNLVFCGYVLQYNNVYQIGPIVVAFILNPLIMKYFGISQILSCSFTTIGLWLYLGLLAFIFNGIGVSFFYQVPLCMLYNILDLSKLWFEPEERILSTFIGQYASNLGMLIGYIVSAFYFNGIVQYYVQKTDFEVFKPMYENLLFFNAVSSIVSLLASFVTLKNPDNLSGRIDNRETIGNSIIKICTTKEGVFDLLAVGSFIGVSWTYPALFGAQQYMIGQTYMDVTYSSIVFQVGQIFQAFYCTWQLMKQSKKGMQQEYDKYIKYTIGQGFLVLTIELVMFELLPVSLIIIMNFFIGAGVGGLYSVLLESLMEKHFPVSELAIGSLLSAISAVESMTVTMVLVLPQYIRYGFQISAFLMIPSYCYITTFYRTSFKRFESDA